MSRKTYVCPGCHGVVTGTRRFTFDKSVEHHQQSCPNRARITTKEDHDQQEPVPS